ncbi:MAG: LytR C-terminal domain-containing protein, partial [Chloroflexota bacterium]
PTLTQQNASIAVLNGTAAPGIASQVESTVQGLGFHPTATSNADRTDYRQCQVIINTSVPGDVSYTARRLQRLLNATLIREPLPGQPAQIVAIIGSDFPTG